MNFWSVGMGLAWQWNLDWHWLVLDSTILGYVLTLFLIRWVLLTRNRSPNSSIAWIVVIVVLPLVGGLLFVLFGINRVERRAARKRAAAREVERDQVDLATYAFLSDEANTDSQRRLMRLATRVCGTIPTRGNEVELVDDTNRTLGLIRQAVMAARETVHLEYYIWQPDKTGTELRDLLIERAKAGLKVRFLYDGVGSMSIWLQSRFLKPMRAAGIQVASFLPGLTFRERWSLNLRNHRKIVIVDGAVGFTGGMNIGDEYHGQDRSLGFWRDTHLRVRGPTVRQLQQIFAEDWYYATGEELPDAGCFPPVCPAGEVTAQVISGEPAADTHAFLALMFAAINEARDRVTLAMSYFVPPDPLVTALENAALRGVRVRLLVAGRSAHSWTVWAGRSYYETLMRAGVEIHEYERGLLHSKTLTIDGHWSLVGSANFDNRSLMLNFEAGVVLYDAELAAELERQFESDLQFGRRIELETWVRRPRRRVLLENACRLFAPVL